MRGKIKIKRNLLRGISGGEFSVVDNRTGLIFDPSDTFEPFLPSERKRVLFTNFIKMSIDGIDRLPLSNAELKYLLILARNTSRRQVISFDEMEEMMNARHFQKIRSKLRRTGLIDKLQLGFLSKWYMNPHVFAKSATCKRELFEHFRPLSLLIRDK